MKEQEDRRNVLKRLRRIKRNETICLAGWEVLFLLEYIEELERSKILKIEKGDEHE